MDQPRVGVEVEDHRFGGSEEGLELTIRHAVGVFGVRHQPEQVHHVHEPDPYVGQVLPEQGGGGQGLHGGDVAAARHDHVGLGPLVVAGPVPDAGALRAVRDGRLHVQVLQVYLFIRHDDVDIVNAAQAVVGYEKQAVGVGRQVDAHHAGALVGNHVPENRDPGE